MISHMGMPVTTIEEASAIYRFTSGVDIGQKRDWTTIITTAFPIDEPADGSIWQTSIVGMWKLKADMATGEPSMSLLDIVERGCQELLDLFPNEKIITDATRDTTATDIMARRYGANVVEGLNFASDSRRIQAWHDALYYVNDPRGYPWASPPPGTRLAQWTAELQEQMTIEEARLNDMNRWSFRHPGPHNDWLHAFEMDHYGVRQVQQGGRAPVIVPMAGAPAFTQAQHLKPPFLADIDSRAGRDWGRGRSIPWR